MNELSQVKIRSDQQVEIFSFIYKKICYSSIKLSPVLKEIIEKYENVLLNNISQDRNISNKYYESAELEFIIESDNKLYPIDVKKGRGTLNSLNKFSNNILREKATAF